jgi:hypothetical protein
VPTSCAPRPKPDDLASNRDWDILTAEPGGVDYLEGAAAGITAIWALPHGIGADAPVLLCFHGGGYVGGSMFTHRKMFAHLAKAIGARARDRLHPPARGDLPAPAGALAAKRRGWHVPRCSSRATGSALFILVSSIPARR